MLLTHLVNPVVTSWAAQYTMVADALAILPCWLGVML